MYNAHRYCCSVAKLCPTFVTQWTTISQASLPLTISQSSFKLSPLNLWCHPQVRYTNLTDSWLISNTSDKSLEKGMNYPVSCEFACHSPWGHRSCEFACHSPWGHRSCEFACHSPWGHSQAQLNKNKNNKRTETETDKSYWLKTLQKYSKIFAFIYS